MTLSGIFRDLLPLQTRLLAEAAYKAATADEPLSMNFIRAHALAHADRWAATGNRAAGLSNAEGAYGSNVNAAGRQLGLRRRGRTGRRL
jgi:magnesium chelatase subunit H